MATREQVELVKVNLQVNQYQDFTDEQITALLDAHGSAAYVSYKLSLLRSSNDAVTIGPISLKGDSEYWQRMSKLFYDEYLGEQQAEKEKSSNGSTLLMRRADGT